MTIADGNSKIDARAKASPTKAFFVRMLTRDITLEDCILDLIDNAVDAAWSSANATPSTFEAGTSLSGYKIGLYFDTNRFEVVDTCGGIPLDAAIDYAFNFGRRQGKPTGDFAVGVYGIGMKRAIFKLGQRVNVRSTPTNEESFVVPIDVEEWLNDEHPDWTFDIDAAEPLPAPGLQIVSEQLSDEAETAFRDPEFEPRLRRTIGQDYLLALMQDLEISVNKQPVEIADLTLKTGSEFQPMRDTYIEDGVTVEVYAGMMNEPPDDPEMPKRQADRHSGWYVLCNGRVVLAADRTSLTIWGLESIPMWHRQYEGFVGIVLFSAKRPELLPMTTTKNGVDSSSQLYRRAREYMYAPTRAWIDYTNARKTRIDEAKQQESRTRSVPLQDVLTRANLELPRTQPRNSPAQAHVNYAVPRSRIIALARALGSSTMNYRQVGLESFEYTYDHLVEEDDE